MELPGKMLLQISNLPWMMPAAEMKSGWLREHIILQKLDLVIQRQIVLDIIPSTW